MSTEQTRSKCVSKIASHIKSISCEQKLKILFCLIDGDKRPRDISKITGVNYALTYFHLKDLTKSDWLERENGNPTIYKLTKKQTVYDLIRIFN